MKIRSLWALGVALAVSSGTWAGTAPPASSIDPADLGSLDAVLTYCRHANPGHVTAYQSLKILTIGSLPYMTLHALESTSQYQDRFTAIGLILDGLPRLDGKQACQALIP